ncbi:hypothetical protein KJY73_16520 [Bowmanella sp. Y26]|uniref:hypothetical protein n=1 Tax=Bowmanella yangjiangensis TaxID=2811230 RepID=UPI001BDBE566|nr:hypothetical protein [Bowmanella yangjiangensis]MBT1065196.1 hypothetical protein [Bowmanella yangjiangensis]
MRKIFIFLLLLSQIANASPTISDISLTPQEAFCLGFTLVRPTDENVGLSFPQVIDDKWFPVATLVQYSFNSTPIFITKTKFEKSDKQDHMVILGFYETIHSGGDAAISITYQCKSGCGVDYLKNYTVPSIVNYVNSGQQLCL